MSEPTPVSANDDPKKRLREKVDKLLAQDARKSQGSIVVDGRTLKYDAIAEFIPVSAGGLDEKRGEPEAAVFTTSYFLADSAAASRPVCFVFNGGPGSSSIWLHLGALGPKRVVIRDDGTMPPPPYTVTDNPDSWFEHFDLVFIDPPHTGYSVTASEDARKRMLSVDGDVDALAECMRTWLGRHRRWSSPVYLAGESYGTTRGAALADKLQSIGVALSGLVLVSCAMDLQSIIFAPRNDLPYALFVPAFACVAQFHGKLAGSLAESPAAARAAAESFVAEEYLGALHAGARLTQSARRRIIHRLDTLSAQGASGIRAPKLLLEAPLEAARFRSRRIEHLPKRPHAVLGRRVQLDVLVGQFDGRAGVLEVEAGADLANCLINRVHQLLPVVVGDDIEGEVGGHRVS